MASNEEDVPDAESGRHCCGGCLLTLTQFFLLLWKNFILQFRRPIGTVFEIFVPIAAVIIIVGFRFGLFQAEDKCFVTFESDLLDIPFTQPYTVYYTPNTTEANELAGFISPQLILSGGSLVGVATEEELVTAIHQGESQNRTLGCFPEGVGIYFENLTTNDVRYTLRFRQNPNPDETWHTDDVSTFFQPRGARVKPNSYLNEGFLHLEKIVNDAIIAWKVSPAAVNFDVNVRQFPYPKYRQDTFLQVINFILPLFVILAFIYSAGVFVKELVLEKESRIRETMKMMGLSNWVLISTWFIKQLIFYLIPIVIMTIILRFGQVFPKSNIVLVFVYLIMYAVSGIAFCFFISVWFSTARIGLMAGFICWFVAYFPFLFIFPNYETLPLGAKVGSCIIPNSCVGFGVVVLSALELRQEGLNFANFATPISLDDELHMGWIILMLAIDTFIYMYIDAIKPGRYGVPKPFYFIFLPSFWCGYRRKSTKDTKLEENLLCDPSAFEKDPVNIPVGIDIDNLTKIYNRRNSKKRKVAVDCLSLKLYKGQITALLGHNGAGKTTTMSILTGLFPPTSGSAYINGLSVVDDIDLIRRNLGICPQHNVLFDRLTVTEHLNFFARLKGARGKYLKPEINTLVEDLLLTDKRSTQSQNLSGGMKRKLSVGIALVGGSKIVILDEPTSGMDPYARRATWDLLVKHKEGRTIMLTTHFMDEADLLGDRIAIMAEGKLKCCGSSLFLKSRYGVGYHMTMVKEPFCNSTAITAMVSSMVAGAEQVTDVGAELSFILPSQSAHQFPQLFDVLDDRKKELGISSFGISVTTMEEVFIRVASGTDEVLLQESRQFHSSGRKELNGGLSTETTFATNIEGDKEVQTAQMIFVNEEAEYPTPAATPAASVRLPGQPGHPSILTDNDVTVGVRSASPTYGTFSVGHVTLNTGLALWIQQFYAIFLKRFYNSLRFWVAIIWQLIIPMIFVLWGLILGVSDLGRNSDDPSRLLSVSNSAPESNITFFFAQFAGSNWFSSEDAALLGATDFFDYTSDILNMVNSVQNFTNPDQCCNYNHQLLDKYCASVPLSQLNKTGTVCPNNENFGYRHCGTCLSCCEAKSRTLSTCTSPSKQDFSTSRAGRLATNYCPIPPSVSIDSQYGDLPTGALDSMNVYVAEKLLDVSTGFDVFDFSLRFQGGFVVHSPEPTYSVCGCNDTEQSCSLLARALTNNTLSPLFIRNLLNNLRNVSTLLNNFCDIPVQFPPETCFDLNETEWNYNFNYLTDTCTVSCNGTSCQCTAGETGSTCTTDQCNCRVGQTSQPPPTNNRPVVTVWYNNQPYHMIAAALNGFYNIYLNRTLNSNVTITVTNNPLPRNLETQISDAQREFLGFTISSTAVFGFSFLFASFVIFLVQERDTKAKHLQFVSGVQASSYWLATFVWDLINAFIPAVLATVLFAAFQIDGYKDENIGAIFLLIVLGCWAAIPVNYIASFLFSNALVAFCLMLVFFYFGSLVFQVIVFLLQPDNPDLSDKLNYIFLLHPAYALGIGLSTMYTNQGIKAACEQSEFARSICEQNGVEYADSVFEFSPPAIGHIFLYMAVEGVLFLILTIIIERELFIPEVKRLFKSHKVATTGGNGFVVEFPEEDNDVLDEKRKVSSMTSYSETDAVVIKSLSKEYKPTSSFLCPCIPKCQEGCKLAVNYISLIIPAGECFGLLGVNGAGKTTTFKMLTGDITPSSGTAILSGFDISTQLRLVQQRIGYCPQFDALIERLTGRELLTMFARLRGIPEKAIKSAVQTEIDRLDLVKYANKTCGTYSGGNKRKLSTAVTLVGDPPILLLDEPTTGMDPATRRFLWDVLTGVIREGRSVILTSHSMEECEALCTRLAIMVNGNFKCLGSIQHLKSKFGSGYTLQMKIQPEVPEKALEVVSSRRSLRRTAQSPRPTSPTGRSSDPFDTSEVEAFIIATFPGSILLEHHQGSVTYQVPAEGVTWSSIFRTVEENKERLRIIDYSVSQTTLDQVFINFAQEQEESDI